MSERAREKGVGIKQLSELTGISAKNIEGIFSGDPARLPSPPYLKGYLWKLGEVLDFNPEEAWEEMKKLAAEKSSGKGDEITRNRFSRKPANKYLIIGAVALAIILYLGFRFYEISGTPALRVENPAEALIVTVNNRATISGKVSNSDELTVNGEKIEIQANGDWRKDIELQAGINNVEVKAKKFLGREAKIVRQIMYQPATGTSGQVLSQ